MTKKLKVIAIPPKPLDEAFEALDRLAHQLILEMRRNNPAPGHDVVEFDRRGFRDLSTGSGEKCFRFVLHPNTQCCLEFRCQYF